MRELFEVKQDSSIVSRGANIENDGRPRGSGAIRLCLLARPASAVPVVGFFLGPIFLVAVALLDLASSCSRGARFARAR